NAALIAQWNDIQDKVKTDYELAQRLQEEEQEELTIEEKSKLFQQLLEKRRKYFIAKRAEEKRNRPPTKAQQRSIIVNTFVDMDTKLVEGSKVRAEGNETIAQESSLKRVGEEIEQEKAKKQKIHDDQKEDEMKRLMEIVPDEEEVAMDAIPLATKPPIIVDWKIIKEGNMETLWKLVKAKHGSTRPKEGYKRLLWGDLRTMFKPPVESAVWRSLDENKGRIARIKRLLDVLEVTAAQVTTAERLQLLEEFMLTEMRSKTYQRKDKD
ncbi:hypothetical protein Tco_0581448, partial [Tanacetum coccineum]